MGTPNPHDRPLSGINNARDVLSYPLSSRLSLTQGSHEKSISVIPVTESCADDDFERAIHRICSNVTRSVKENSAFDTLIGGEKDAIYVKAVDGKVLLSNRAYDSLFAGEMSPVGRLSASFLTHTVLPISSHSDEMILNGCPFVQFIHIGHDTDGRELRFLTHKRSLLGLGHPAMAILGITRLLEVLNSRQQNPQPSLRSLWGAFSDLEELDRNIAIGLARGKNVGAIALENGVTKKTIENHRSSILKTLGFDSPIDVIKMIVRLQENGFGDFGV